MTLPRKLIVLAGVLALLAIVSVYLWKFGHPGTPTGNPLKKTDLTKVNRLVMVRAENTVTLNKQDGKWKITTPIEDVVDPSIMEDIFTAFKNFSLGSVISENAARYSEFSLDPAHEVHLKVYAENKEKPVFDAHIGKYAASFENCYFRFEGSTPVYIANGFPEYQFRRDPSGFRLMKPFVGTTEQVTDINIKLKKDSYSFRRSSGTAWFDGNGSPVQNGEAVRLLLTQLIALEATDFSSKSENDEAVGLDKPYAQITLQIQGEAQQLMWGKLIEKSDPKEPQIRYAKVSGRPAVMVIREDSIKSILGTLKTTR